MNAMDSSRSCDKVNGKLTQHCLQVVAVCMDGACKGSFPIIKQTFKWMQCFVCPAHGIDNFIKNVCSNKQDILMQGNASTGVAAAEVEWDVDLFKDTFDECWTCVKAVTRHHKPLALFRAIVELLPASQKPEGGTEPVKLGMTR